MPAATSHLVTPHASRYLQQLCKHFAHKVAVDFDPQAGEVRFPFGRCRMEARDGGLFLRCESPGAAELARTKAVVDDHLVRFAWREKLQPVWEPAEEPS